MLQGKIAGPKRQDTHRVFRRCGRERRRGEVVAPDENLAAGPGAFLPAYERHGRASGQTAEPDDGEHDGRDHSPRARER